MAPGNVSKVHHPVLHLQDLRGYGEPRLNVPDCVYCGICPAKLQRRHVEGAFLGAAGNNRADHDPSFIELKGADLMKPAATIGILLIILGVFALAYQGFTYTTHKKVLDIGPIEATKEEHKTVPLPPVLGGIALAAGAVLLFAGSKRQ